MKIDGTPVLHLDMNDEDDQRFWADQEAYPNSVNLPPTDESLEGRASLLARSDAAGGKVITDDNMAPEWRKVLRFQDPPH
jgi:hypothetical protein